MSQQMSGPLPHDLRSPTRFSSSFLLPRGPSSTLGSLCRPVLPRQGSVSDSTGPVTRTLCDSLSRNRYRHVAVVLLKYGQGDQRTDFYLIVG